MFHVILSEAKNLYHDIEDSLTMVETLRQKAAQGDKSNSTPCRKEVFAWTRTVVNRSFPNEQMIRLVLRICFCQTLPLCAGAPREMIRGGAGLGEQKQVSVEYESPFVQTEAIFFVSVQKSKRG